MLYKCDKCNKFFNHKCHYLNHINRKFPCTKNRDHNDLPKNETNNNVDKMLTKC